MRKVVCMMIICLAVLCFPFTSLAAGHHLLLIGDSRTEGMAAAVGSGDENIHNYWCYESGKGLQHMANRSFPYIDGKIIEIREAFPEDMISVICMYGVNDTHNVKDYAMIFNMKAEEYPDIRFFFVSVNPIADEKSGYRWDKDKYVTDFNEKIRPLLSDRITYIDTYSMIKDTFREHTRDGVHYDAAMYREIYGAVRDVVTAPHAEEPQNETDQP